MRHWFFHFLYSTLAIKPDATNTFLYDVSLYNHVKNMSGFDFLSETSYLTVLRVLEFPHTSRRQQMTQSERKFTEISLKLLESFFEGIDEHRAYTLSPLVFLYTKYIFSLFFSKKKSKFTNFKQNLYAIVL